MGSEFSLQTSEVQSRIAALEEENQRLKKTLEWKDSALAILEHYTKHIRLMAAEHSGDLAIAVFSCLKTLPFDPFQNALDVNNQPLSTREKAKLALQTGETWHGRFIAYYSSLTSHLLTVYQNKLDEHQQPLAALDRLTLTGVRVDQSSPIFNEVLTSKEPYRTFLEKATYGLDMVVKVFPIFGERRQVIGMISFTHDITSHLEQRRMIADGLKAVQHSALSIFQEIDRVQEVSTAIRSFSQEMQTHDEAIHSLAAQIAKLETSLESFINTIEVLSLNARIEAACAGEAGKRFGVIGDEITQLTHRMLGHTTNLQAIVEQIHEVKTFSSEKMQKIDELSGQINLITDELKQEGVNYEGLLKTISTAEASYKQYMQSMLS